MRSRLFAVIIVALILFFALNTAELSAEESSALHVKPYDHKIFLPAAYLKNNKLRLPGLFIYSHGFSGYFEKLKSWADKRGVVLLNIDISEKLTQGTTRREKLLRTIESLMSTYPIHPRMRHSMGEGGAAMTAMLMAKSSPAHHAGILLINHSGNSFSPPPHIPIAFVTEKDNAQHHHIYTMRAAANFEKRGTYFSLKITKGSPTKKDIQRKLDWMISVSSVSSPMLSQKSHTNAARALIVPVANTKSLKSPSDRLEILQHYYRPPFVEHRALKHTTRKAWGQAVEAYAKNTDNNYDKLAKLTEIIKDEHFDKCPTLAKKALKESLAIIFKNANMKKEFHALRMLAKARKKRWEALTDASRIQDAKDSYKKVIGKFEKTQTASTAKEELAELKILNTETK